MVQRKDNQMKLDLRIPGRPKDKGEYYIKFKKPEQLSPILNAVRHSGSWNKFTDLSIHALDCSVGSEELKDLILEKTGLKNTDFYIINPYKFFWPNWLP